MPRRFTRQADNLLYKLVKMYGKNNWIFIADSLNAQLNGEVSSDSSTYADTAMSVFTPRQCRDRWKSYLCYNDSPAFSTNWTNEEDCLLIEKYKQIGPKWAYLAQFFPWHTSISVKNRYLELNRKGFTHYCNNLTDLDSYYDSDYDYDDSPTFHMTARQTYCPSSFRKETKQELYFKYCTAKTANQCNNSSKCFTCSLAKFTCPICNSQGLSASETEIDHIKPVAKYLPAAIKQNKTKVQISDWYNDTDNLQILCRTCNRKKSDK